MVFFYFTLFVWGFSLFVDQYGTVLAAYILIDLDLDTNSICYDMKMSEHHSKFIEKKEIDYLRLAVGTFQLVCMFG